MIDRVKKDIKILEEKIQSERMIFENLKEKDKKLQMLCEKCSLYSDEYKNRVLWSKILGLIGDSLPSGMWITKLSYKNDLTGGNKNLIVIVEGFISPFYINPDKGCLIFTRKLKEKGLGILENVSLKEIIKGEKEGNEIYYFKFAIKFKK
ncbi:MAG: hypothetical protein N2589_04375 [bacterium]|nr:hypothetical protein [bacterium]